MRFQKFIDCRSQSGTVDRAAIFRIGKAFDCFHLRHLLRGPDEPDLFRALLLIELKPALLWNLNLLICSQERRAVVGRLGWKHYVEGRDFISSRGTLVQQIKAPAL